MRLIRISFVVVLLLISTFSWAQPQPQNPSGDPDEPVPITGVEYLLLAGGAFGIQRIIKGKNKLKKEA